MSANKGRPYYPATAKVEQKEREFEVFYSRLLDSVSEKQINPEMAIDIIMNEYILLKADPWVSSSCVYTGREAEMREELRLAWQRAELGMAKSKSLAQLAEEKPKAGKASFIVPLSTFALAFGLSFIAGDRSRVPDCEQRAPGSIRHDPYRHPQYLIDDAPKKEPEKDQKKNSVPRWE
jgi:hypothetical protein